MTTSELMMIVFFAVFFGYVGFQWYKSRKRKIGDSPAQKPSAPRKRD